MRKKDKLLHITKLNKRLNENKFNWNGQYANEEVNEDMATNEDAYTNPNNDDMAYGDSPYVNGGDVISSDDSTLEEHHSGEYSNEIMDMKISDFLNTLKSKDKTGYEVVEKVIENNFKESIEEDEYSYPYDASETYDDNDENITDPYKLKEMRVGMGDDLEYVDENCGCSVNENEPTDVENSKWFSDEDGERIMDIQVD